MTEGLERRLREADASLLSLVDSVELLADDECLLSVAEVGERFPVACLADGSQAGSGLTDWSILICNCNSIFLHYIYNATIIMAPKKTGKNAMQCSPM